jgi:hypothetical protein
VYDHDDLSIATESVASTLLLRYRRVDLSDASSYVLGAVVSLTNLTPEIMPWLASSFPSLNPVV